MTDFLPRLSAATVILALAACAAEPGGSASQEAAGRPGPVQSAGTSGNPAYEGRFTGPVVPTTPNCGMAGTGRLRFTPGTRTGRFTFEQGLGPQGFGITTLYGDAGPDGTLRGGPNPVGFFTPGTPPAGMPGPNQPPRLEATLRRADGTAVITGTLVSGLCRWTVNLRQA